jgi:hypothetical protein
MSTETITITNYAPDRFARLETTLQDKTKLKFVGYSGEAKEFGADVKFAYDPTAQTLTLNILHGPHLHNFDAFCAELTTFIENQK